jgi:hypothetical protein
MEGEMLAEGAERHARNRTSGDQVHFLRKCR